MQDIDHEFFMNQALREAELAFDKDEVPIGAVVVLDNKVIGRGHNLTQSLKDATAHAEMIAITSAAEKIGDWRLEDCILYSTIEPCTMCAGAAVLSRIRTIYYGARDSKFGACGSIFDIPRNEKLNHRIEVIAGLMEGEAVEIMQKFFKKLREKKGETGE